ncbi:MAG: PH domain-containing protein [Candidatus Aenigmarchaeota archaeon]|jgi:membrane protein YdbS with pleckstrin-like domain|nr:PH domain-containing protein [Candidatus Aenigmarchaeota archaeon]
MKIKSSLVSQLLDITIILLTLITIVFLKIYYDFEPFKPSIQFLLVLLLLAADLYVLNDLIIRRIYTYEIDDAGVKENFTIFSKRETFIPYYNITNVELKKSFIGRVLNYGNVEVSSPKTKIILIGIKDPERIYNKIKEKIEMFKTKIKENEEH